jgi:hypothetical protein
MDKTIATLPTLKIIRQLRAHHSIVDFQQRINLHKVERGGYSHIED